MSVNRIADIEGKSLYGGDEIILTDWIMELDEASFTEGTVIEEDGKFFLQDRQLFLTDIFKITRDGEARHKL